MSKPINVCAAALLLAAGGTALAAMDFSKLPKLKSGLWVTTVSNEGSQPTTHSMCMDQATQQRMMAMGQGMMAGMCSKSDMRLDGNVIVTDADCAMGPMRVKSTSRTTFTGDSSYSTETTSVFDPPMMGRGSMRSTAQGKHSGACPAGMKPGDIKLPDGRMMNINNLPGMMQPQPR